MILGDNIAQQVFHVWQFQWCPDVVMYLGMLAPSDIMQIVLNRLIRNIADLNRWAPSHLTGLGKVNTCKMNALCLAFTYHTDIGLCILGICGRFFT